MSDKPRLLITISISFAVRYIIRTGLLKKLSQWYEPVIAISWNEEKIIAELHEEGYEVYIIPPGKKSARYNDVRKKIDAWFNHFRLQSPSQKIQDDYLRQYVSWRTGLWYTVKKWYTVMPLYISVFKKKLFRDELSLLFSETNYFEISAFVASLKVDAVFSVTPFHKEEDLLLRACKLNSKKMITAILSFDNITKRGWLPVEYDLYMVWNLQNKNQLLRIYPAIKKDTIHITGAPQFDFYFNTDWQMSENEWKKILGLPDEDCNIILYAGGPVSLLPNETQYLQHLDAAINQGELPGNTIILFRCHPIDHIERWKKAIGNSKNIFFDESWTGKGNIHHAGITEEDIRKLCATLAYTDVHVNLCSTMTVDGSAFDKPQVGPAYDEVMPATQHLLRDMYRQEHFLPIIETGGLEIAESKKDFKRAIKNVLDDPARLSTNRQEILNRIITYTDGKSTERVVAVLKGALNQPINNG